MVVGLHLILKVYGKLLEKQLKPVDLLLGRKTFKIFADYWQEHENEWPGINHVTKYVMSNIGKTQYSSKAWQTSKSSKIQKVLIFKFTAVASSFSYYLGMI
jgi:hypothetical protein